MEERDYPVPLAKADAPAMTRRHVSSRDLEVRRVQETPSIEKGLITFPLLAAESQSCD